MRYLLIIGLLLIAVLQPAFSEDPSREETVSWLKGKLTDYRASWTHVDDPTIVGEWTVHSFGVSDGKLTIKISSIADGRGFTVTYIANLSQLTPRVSISQNPYSSMYFLSMEGTPQCVTMISEQGESSLNAFSFVMGDAALAERVGKALEHLVRLHGGKDEPF